MTYETSINQDQDKRGWILVSENIYSASSPLVIQGSTRTKLLMGSDANIFTPYGPKEGATWWSKSENKIKPRDIGSMWIMRLNADIESKKKQGDSHA